MNVIGIIFTNHAPPLDMVKRTSNEVKFSVVSNKENVTKVRYLKDLPHSSKSMLTLSIFVNFF